MTTKRNAYECKYFAVVLYTLFFTGFVYGLEDDRPVNSRDNLISWHLLDTTKILLNATNNIVVSPKNLTSLLKAPPQIDLRFGNTNSQTPGQGIILIESRKKLRNPEQLELFYHGKIQEISFNEKTKVLKAINDWGNRTTDQKFSRFFTSESELNDLEVLIINIFHFNETLQVNFKYSVNETFYVTPKNIIKVPSVETTDYFDYLDSQILDAKVLRLPYSSNLSMYILLPHTKQGVDELLNNLGHEQLKRMQWMMEESRVNVLLPKFKFFFKTNLEENIRPSNHIFDVDLQFAFGELVDKVNIFHITTINFDGNGKGTADSKIRQSKYEKFHVDRPFVVYIEEDSTGDIICIAKVLNPAM